MASRGHRQAHKRSYVPKTSSKIRKGYRHGNMRKRRKQKNKDKKKH